MLRAGNLLPLLAAGCAIAFAQSDSARSLLSAGSDLYNQSHYPEAMEQLQRAEGLAREQNDIELLLEIKEVEGNALRTLGRLDEALRDYREWFQLNKQLLKPQPEGRATRFLSALYREMGDIDKSEAIARQALKLARTEGNTQLEAGCLLTLGALQKDRGRYSEAIGWHEQALALAEREKMARLQAEILNSLGDAEHHLGRLEKAEEHFRGSMELAKAAGYLGLEAQVTARTGEVDMARGRYDDAIDLFARASALNHQLGDPLTKVFVVDLDWAQAEHAAGHPEEALMHYREAIAEVERLEQLTVPTEMDRALPVAISRQAYEEAADLLVELDRPSEALEVADSGRARAFLDLLRESHIGGGSLLTNIERPNPASAEVVQRELADSDTVFVEYLLAKPRSLAWVVTNEGLHAISLAPRERIEALLKPQRKLLSQPVTSLTPEHLDRQQRQQSRELYRMLIDPLARYIGGAKHLMIVPDGVLAYVPFESLLDSKGRYLLETHTIVYSQSASASLMLRALAKEMPPPKKSLLVLADPVYDVASLTPIPYTRDEATAIASLFPSGQREIRLGAQASESAVKQEDLRRFGYLHFAVHGLVDDSEPARSGLALSHGVLRSEEIARLRMNARLVVLSGCRTGAGKLLEGEGLLTMSRAFYYAGARNVVATLWNVDDLSTADLMKSFYRRLNAGSSPEDALREAKIQMLHGSRNLWRHPWFWSPFVIFR